MHIFRFIISFADIDRTTFDELYGVDSLPRSSHSRLVARATVRARFPPAEGRRPRPTLLRYNAAEQHTGEAVEQEQAG